MKFTQIQSHMLPSPAPGVGPVIGLFALGEDGNVYQYQRFSPTNQYWEKLSNQVLGEVSQETRKKQELEFELFKKGDTGLD